MVRITCEDVKHAAGTAVDFADITVQSLGAYPLVFGQGIGAVRVLVALGLSAYDVAGMVSCAGAAALFSRYESTMGWAENAGPRAQQHWDSLKGRDIKQLSIGIQEFTALRLAIQLAKFNSISNEDAEAKVGLRPAQQFGTFLMAGMFLTPIVGTPPAAILLIVHVALGIINGIRYGCSGSDEEKQGVLKKRAIHNVTGVGVGAMLMIPGGFIPFALLYGCLKCCRKKKDTVSEQN